MNPAIKDTNKDVIQKALEIMKNSTDFSKMRFIAVKNGIYKRLEYAI